MQNSGVSGEGPQEVQGMYKDKEKDRFRREVGGNNVNVAKGELR